MTIVLIDENSPNSTMFGTFFVKNPKNSDEGGYNIQSIYPSTYSTLTPSSELHSWHFISDQDSNDSFIQDSVDKYGDQVYLLRRQPKLKNSSKLRNLNHVISTNNRSYYILKVFKNLISSITSYLSFPKFLSEDSHVDIGIDIINNESSFQFMSITHRKPLNIVSLMALFYSYIPFLSCLFIFPLAIRLGILFAVYIGIYCMLLAVINEATFKKIFKQPRPKRSLVKSYGMPSTHSMVSYCLLTLLLLESFFLPGWKLFSTKEILLCCLILIPVPWGRLYLEDHTFEQCGFGCLEGVIFGLIGFQLRKLILPL